MYNPRHFKCDNPDEAFEFMDRYPFATLVSAAGGNPVISHLPLIPQSNGHKIELIGHLARANPHWKVVAQSPTTAIFHGPHTFITPKWYAKNDVPTWNYSAIHLTGTVELIENFDELEKCLKTLASHAEKHWPSGWNFFVPEDLRGDALSRAIVGIKIHVEQIDFKKKLSQNRPAPDQMGVIEGLKHRKDENSHLVMKDMIQLIASKEKTDKN